MGPQKEALGPSAETLSPKEVPPETPGGQTKRAGLPWLKWVGVPKPGSPNLDPRLLSTTLRLSLLKPSLKATCPVFAAETTGKNDTFSQRGRWRRLNIQVAWPGPAWQLPQGAQCPGALLSLPATAPWL